MDKVVLTLASPPSGNRITYDDEAKGFGVRITSAGANAFILNYRANGRERRLTIGSFPDWSVSAARDEAGVYTLRPGLDAGDDALDAVTTRGAVVEFLEAAQFLAACRGGALDGWPAAIVA